MDDLQKLIAERACEKPMISYARLIDAYRYDDFMNLWTQDATLNMLGREHKGVPAIRQWLEQRKTEMICRHFVTNIETEILSDTNARGFCYSFSYHVQDARGFEPGPMEPPTFIIEYESEFRREPERGWLFSRRSVTAALVGEEQMLALRGESWKDFRDRAPTGKSR